MFTNHTTSEAENQRIRLLNEKSVADFYVPITNRNMLSKFYAKSEKEGALKKWFLKNLRFNSFLLSCCFI
ncbi:hypothetical protein BDF21DRAFT_63935 [Thamnidium elegans]|nr:hypothetical protein BDF21DRAFT_63935 [Thamnidium elegans]